MGRGTVPGSIQIARTECSQKARGDNGAQSRAPHVFRSEPRAQIHANSSGSCQTLSGTHLTTLIAIDLGWFAHTHDFAPHASGVIVQVGHCGYFFFESGSLHTAYEVLLPPHPPRPTLRSVDLFLSGAAAPTHTICWGSQQQLGPHAWERLHAGLPSTRPPVAVRSIQRAEPRAISTPMRSRQCSPQIIADQIPTTPRRQSHVAV